MIDFQAKVLTPYGERLISELRIGDPIFSAMSGQLVRNYVKKRVEGSAAALLRFWCDRASITCEFRQYLAVKNGSARRISYRPVESLVPGEFLYRSVDGLTAPEEITGMESMLSKGFPLLGLKLENYPFNYIADGFVVGSE